MNDINIRQLESRLINTSSQKQNIKVNQSKQFADVLKKIQSNNDEIKFSKHAIDRMNERDVKLNRDEVVKLEEAFKKAEEKGINEALILIGDKGFIASVRNKTVITTIVNDKLKENVFTNIDGAVIL